MTNWLIQKMKLGKQLTLSSRVSFTGLPLCDQSKFGGGKPATSHSNFIFCPALAITFERGVRKVGGSVGSKAAKKKNHIIYHMMLKTNCPAQLKTTRK